MALHQSQTRELIANNRRKKMLSITFNSNELACNALLDIRFN
jgi:hypothetical protein